MAGDWLFESPVEVEAVRLQLTTTNAVTFTIPGPLHPNESFVLQFAFNNSDSGKSGEWIGLYEIAAADEEHHGRIYRIEKKTRKKGRINWAGKYAPDTPGKYEVTILNNFYCK